MLYFENDYSEGCHPLVLKRLCETNLTPAVGYGEDEFSQRAREYIRAACSAPEADIFFISGGTQTNAVAIGGILRPWEGVVSASTGHIGIHEAGAVEFTGHKVLSVPGHMGKLDAGELSGYLEGFYSDPNHTHMVFPGMVYISHPTEYGTLYTLGDLEAISEACRRFHIPLYMDGARLAYALASITDVSLGDIARLCDIFYIGGTKCGALCGEALVFPRGAPEHFDTVTKQRGAMLAKGRLCGVQFEALFEKGLYFELGRSAVELAMEIRSGLLSRGIPLFIDSPTNQQFPILGGRLLERLSGHVRYSFWEPLDAGRSVVRFATSWATGRRDVEELFKVLDNCAGQV